MNDTATMTGDAMRPEDEQYGQLLAALRARAALMPSEARLFTTDATGLFAAFLDALPATRRQHYVCRSCERFVDRFGGLATVAADGTIAPALWTIADAPPFFAGSVRAVARKVARARVTGVFLCGETTWGTPSNKSAKAPYKWHHMSSVPSQSLVFRSSGLLDASQTAAARHEEYAMLCRSLAEFPDAVARQAHTLLTNGQLFRSEKCVGVAAWLVALHEARATAKGPRRDNVTWLAVASAPAGWCHVRAGMIGTLLADISDGHAFSTIKRKWADKMNPTQYMRPTVAPTAGNIAQAEKLIAAKGLAPSLPRRFARLEECEAMWKPTEAKASETPGGVFGHLKPKAPGSVALDLPAVTMTWEKFARDVLPGALAIEYQVAASGFYHALTTAVDASAPPLIQWDREDSRNPVAWYTYVHGSRAADWNVSGPWAKVNALCLFPHQWNGGARNPNHGEGVLFIIDGARDTTYRQGSGLFPEILRAELHEVRATIEADARWRVVAGKDDATACGIGLRKGQPWNHVVRVTSATGRASYKLDRWD